MAFNVNDFRAKFADGGARPNLFRVQLFNPIGKIFLHNASFEVKTAQLPASSIPSIDVPYFGRQLRVAGNRTFEPWTVTCFNKEDMELRSKMEEWMAAINTHSGNTLVLDNGSQAGTSYKSNATVEHFDKKGNIISTYNFQGVFPTEVAAIELGWDTNDSIEEFSVTLAYDWWENAASEGNRVSPVIAT